MHRGLMSRVFTPRRMNALEEQVRDFCAACLDPLVGTDRFDFVKDLGAEMPMRVIGMLLGIPESDQTAIRDHVRRVPAHRARQADAGRTGTIVSGRLFADYIDWRANHPSDDLMTALLNAEFEDETGTVRTLTREEVLTYTQVVAGAGNETTGRLIGWLGKVLGEHPDQRREIVADRVADPEHDRGDAALRADRSPRRPLRRPRRRVLRHDGAGGQRHAAAGRLGQPRRAPLRRIPTASTSTATTASTSPSATACTSASAPPSLGSRAGSRSTRC